MTEQLTAQQLADAYVARVETIDDIVTASAWAREEFGDLDPQVAEDAAKLVQTMLQEKGVIPAQAEVSTEGEVQPIKEEAAEGSVEASDAVSTEEVETPTEDEKPSENA